MITPEETGIILGRLAIHDEIFFQSLLGAAQNAGEALERDNADKLDVWATAMRALRVSLKGGGKIETPDSPWGNPAMLSKLVPEAGLEAAQPFGQGLPGQPLSLPGAMQPGRKGAVLGIKFDFTLILLWDDSMTCRKISKKSRSLYYAQTSTAGMPSQVGFRCVTRTKFTPP